MGGGGREIKDMFYIYLDTSFLSQLTKAARKETPEASSKTAKWINLLTLLRQGVNRGTLLCPASQFQTQEAMLAQGLLQEFISLQLELSKGYYFKKWQDILVHQVANQALIYLRRPEDIDLGWSVFTKQTPTIIPPFITRQMKSNMALFAKLAKSLSAPAASFQKQYEAEKISLLQETFLQPIRYALGLPTHSGRFDPELLLMLLHEAKIPDNELNQFPHFFDSPLVDQVPFIQIFSSLWASIKFHETTRTDRDSDLLDIIALACAIPYCQVITTDINMKNHIDRLRLNEKYGISVYAPTDEDSDAFAKVLSGLKSK